MSSILAIISKAVFEKMVPKTVAVGDVVNVDRYVSSHAVFEKLSGDAIFLVTVRPPVGRACVPHLDRAIAAEERPAHRSLLVAARKLFPSRKV